MTALEIVPGPAAIPEGFLTHPTDIASGIAYLSGLPVSSDLGQIADRLESVETAIARAKESVSSNIGRVERLLLEYAALCVCEAWEIPFESLIPAKRRRKNRTAFPRPSLEIADARFGLTLLMDDYCRIRPQKLCRLMNCERTSILYRRSRAADLIAANDQRFIPKYKAAVAIFLRAIPPTSPRAITPRLAIDIPSSQPPPSVKA
jgi:hypothetical protein